MPQDRSDDFLLVQGQYVVRDGRTATFAAFIAAARQQSKATYRSVYTAAVVNNYIRQGFGR